MRFYSALEIEPANAANAILMMLYTGARRGNVMEMRWTDVEILDGEHGVWNIPRTKSGKSQRVPLNVGAVAILEAQKHVRDMGNPYVFPGRKLGQSLKTVQQTWERVIRKAGIENIRLHDLRHTFASHAVTNGVSLLAVSKLLGHHSPTMSSRYAHLADRSLHQATKQIVVSLDEHRKKTT